VIDVALDRDRGADAVGDRAGQFDDAITFVDVALDAIAHADGGGRFGGPPVDAHVSGPARVRRFGARLEETDGPQPTIDAHGLLVRSGDRHARTVP
jgi:hypothetical protein